MERKEFTNNSTGKLVNIREDGLVAFVPEDLPDELQLSTGILAKYQDALLSLGALGAAIPALPNPGLLTSPFLAREAVLSSRIEGTHTELDQLYLFEVDETSAEEDDEDPEEVQADAKEVRNYLHALRYGLEQLKTRPIHARLLREMHEILLQDVRGEDKAPGHYRWKHAFVGAATIEHARYIAPPSELVDKLMNALEIYINRPESKIPSLIRIARIHYQFEAIHPFNDGNGRLGRLLISLLLASYGLLTEPLLYLSAYFERHRADYAEALWQVSRNGAWRDWILFFLEGVIEEARDAHRRASELRALREEYRAKLQKSRGSAKSLELVDYLFVSPAIDVRMAERHLNMSYGGANNCVQRLKKAGLLIEATSRSRNRIFFAKPIVDILR